ncbi:DNA/RNA polymerase, partial [Coprinopsis marcescibilis]
YVKSGRWIPTTSYDAIPMMYITKLGKAGEPLQLRMVVDLREHNANTKKLSCPLPDMDIILHRVARAKYRSIIDRQDAYKQICIEPTNVKYLAMMTPEGAVESLVMQQG